MLGRGREVSAKKVRSITAEPAAAAMATSRISPQRLCLKVSSQARRRCSRGRLVSANTKITTLRMSTTTCTNATSGAGSSTIITATLRPDAPSARIALKSRRSVMLRPAAAVANARVNTRRMASSSSTNGGSAVGSGMRPKNIISTTRLTSMTVR